MTYREALDYLYSFADLERQRSWAAMPSRFDLRRMEHLLASVGNPHLGRVTVHIAGTKGKGSTAAMMASVLQQAGYRPGLLTSPHLYDFRERIRLEGRPIAADDLARTVMLLRPHVEAYEREAPYGHLTTFELTTILAFMHFREAGARAQVLEVGLGGRLDATNVVPQPDLCIITPVSYDHMEVLGNTLEAIATEKAGIIKPGAPAVMAPQEPAAGRVIARRCYELGSPLVDVERRIRWERTGADLSGQSFRVKGLRAGFSLWIPLLGEFQVENAAVVVAAFETLGAGGVRLNGGHLAEGLAQVRWPGRMQALPRRTPGDPLLLVDGAHNGASARRLREALLADIPHRKLALVVGASADKDLNAIAAELGPVADLVIATAAGSMRAAAPPAVARAFRPYAADVMMEGTVPDALAAAGRGLGPEDAICATGSLFVVGEVLNMLGLAEEALYSVAAGPRAEAARSPQGAG